jgi:hypothetical protein
MEEMPASNGHDENRLDRIEAVLEALVRSQSHLLESQSTLEQGHKDLLRSQVLMQDELRQFASKSEARFQRIEAKLEQTTLKLDEASDKINGLIDLMDRHLRDHREGRA